MGLSTASAEGWIGSAFHWCLPEQWKHWDEQSHIHTCKHPSSCVDRGKFHNPTITKLYQISPGPCNDLSVSTTEESTYVENANSRRPRTLDISCCSCNSQLGYFSFRTQASTLFKWQVTCTASTTPALPSISECLTSALAAAFAQSGSAKSLLMPLDDDDHGSDDDVVLHVWVLNQRIRFTSTSLVPGRVVPAMKAMWRVVTVAEAEKILDSVLAREQEINLPRGAIEAVRGELEASNLLYPEHDRAFQGWKAGLLRSWEGSPPSSS